MTSRLPRIHADINFFGYRPRISHLILVLLLSALGWWWYQRMLRDHGVVGYALVDTVTALELDTHHEKRLAVRSNPQGDSLMVLVDFRAQWIAQITDQTASYTPSVASTDFTLERGNLELNPKVIARKHLGHTEWYSTYGESVAAEGSSSGAAWDFGKVENTYPPFVIPKNDGRGRLVFDSDVAKGVIVHKDRLGGVERGTIVSTAPRVRAQPGSRTSGGFLMNGELEVKTPSGGTLSLTYEGDKMKMIADDQTFLWQQFTDNKRLRMEHSARSTGRNEVILIFDLPATYQNETTEWRLYVRGRLIGRLPASFNAQEPKLFFP